MSAASARASRGLERRDMHNDDIDTHSEPVPEVRPPFSLLASALPPRHSDRGGLAPAARAQARARSAGARIGRARRVRLFLWRGHDGGGIRQEEEGGGSSQVSLGLQ